MANWPKHPVICELNTWAWLHQLSQEAHQPVTLANVPETELQRLSGLGFDGLWLMGVWRRSPAARRIAREGAEFQGGHRHALPDCTPEDIVGSAYAIFDYQVDAVLGGDDGLAAVRKRLRARGLHLILDFVPNHLARDHPWTLEYSERFVQGTEADLVRDPGSFFRSGGRSGPHVFANGRDPYFPAWTDTVQLDYRRSVTQQAMTDELLSIAARCDGVRCDMAMLENQDTFLKTWGGTFEPSQPEFWLKAIPAVRERYPGFLFLAEVYWGLDQEQKLQRYGFDYTYDKRLYDLLRHSDAGAVRSRLREAGDAYQGSLARFIENHDEERARAAFGLERSRAAAALALALPGLRLMHEGQIEGYQLHLPVRLGRRQVEPPDPDLVSFYHRLLTALRHPVFHGGAWRLLEPRQVAWDNSSSQSFVVYRWLLDGQYRLVAVNLAGGRAQCCVHFDLPSLAGKMWCLRDLLSDARYLRDGSQLLSAGLFLDMPGYGFHIFEVTPGPPHGAAAE
jgi:hypothetical protein